MATSARLLVYRGLRRLKQAEYWIVAQVTFTLLWLARRLPADWSLNVIDRAARLIGPLTPRHRVALDNLRHALPDRSDAERAEIARQMWANMGRLMGEYVFLDQIFDFDPERPGQGRIEVDGIDIFERLLARPDRPAIFFTAHMGNFELLPVAAATYGLNVTALFRPPNNPYLAQRLMAARRTAMGHLVPSRTGAAVTLGRVLDEGGKVGMLVDQRFTNGVATQFFGRDCATSPLLARLARNFDCDIHPARCVRLPGGRFRLTLFERIEPARDSSGRIDPDALTRQVTTIVEDWIRSDPGQWMWFHKRWDHADLVRKPRSRE